HPQSQTVEAHTEARLSCSIKSASPATVSWSKDGVIIPGATSSMLVFSPVTEDAAGTYVMTATNPAGSVSSNPAVLTVVPTSPPRFVLHPRSAVVEIGETLSLSVEVVSSVNHTIQWTRDGTVIPGATSKSLYIPGIKADSAGIYRALATNRAGTTLSQTATIKVVPLKPPVFLRQPTSIQAQKGGDYRLNAWVSSAVPPTYQWYRNGLAIPGATSYEISLGAITESQSGSYHLAATNPAGTTLSEAATVTIVPAEPPVITGHPVDTEVFQGLGFWLSAGASSVLPMSYQWFKDGLPLPSSGSTSFSLWSASDSDSGLYTMVATNSAGSASSRSARVTVRPPGPPRITQHPSSLFAGPGQRVEFTVNTVGPAPMTFQWFKDGQPISGGAGSLHVIPEAAVADGGAYHIEVSNAYGSTASEAAVLTVLNGLPPVPIRLANIDGVEGYYYALDVTQPDYVGAFTCQWYRNGVALPGATSPKLEIHALPPPQTGEYMATISNAVGSVTSTAAFVRISPRSVETSGWTDSARSGHLVFLLNSTAARIDRFDLETDMETAPIPLSNTATATTATATHLYVAFGPDVVRMNHDGTDVMPFASLEGRVTRMLATPDHLLLNLALGSQSGKSRLACLRLADGTVTGLSPYLTEASAALAFDTTTSRVFASIAGSSPTTSPRGTIALALAPDGSLGSLTTSSQGAFAASTSRLHVFPGTSWVIDDSGAAWHTGSLTLSGSLGAPADSIDFASDGRLVALRGSEISIYDDTLARTRRISLASSPRLVVVDGEEAVALSLLTGADRTIGSERVPLVEPALEAPVPAPDPATLAFLPDAITPDREGNVLLLSRWHGALFRWNVREQRYTDAIHVGGHPNHLACIPESNTVVVGYADQSLVAVDLDGAKIAHSIGASLWPIGTMAATSSHLALAAAKVDYTDQRLALLGHHGEIVALAWNTHQATDLQWSPATGSFHFVEATSSSSSIMSLPVTADLHWGALTTTIAQVPYLGSWDPLLRVAPDGLTYATHNGRILDARAATATGPTVAPFNDAAWFRDQLYVIGDSAAGLEIRRLDSAGTVDATLPLQGRAARLLAAGSDRLVLVTNKAGRPHFTLLDADLSVRNHFEDTPDLTKVVLANLSTRAEVGTGDDIIIAGFVVTGSGPKRVLVRAVGPGLNRFGVSGTLADPVLRLVGDSGTIAENDDWFTPDGEALKLAFREVYAFGLAEASLDSALVATLPPGKYTAQVSGKDG
ncbi:MAG: immunoglobulin domain-containing protein, partial [Opitutaceae bacterium]|nr:immunoglobulin domain-containing protein [Opitutaceae bacterium]